jgi:hypothetical protein
MLLEYVKWVDHETRTLPQNGMYLLENTPTVVIMGYVMGFGYITSMHILHYILKVYVNIPYIYLEEVYIGLCVTRLGYKLVNIGGFFREEDIKYSPCNLKHPKSLVGHNVSFQQMEVVWNTPCDNGLPMMQFLFRIIMNTILKVIVGQVLGVFV